MPHWRDHGGVSPARGDARANDPLLDEVGHRQREEQNPKQPCAVLRARLDVGGDGAGVVIGFDDDQAGAKDGEEGEDAVEPSATDPPAPDGWQRGLGRPRGLTAFPLNP